MKKLYNIGITAIAVLILNASGADAQTITMPSGTGSSSVTACSGTFVDAGGGGNYPNNQNSFLTICPTVPGNYVSINFTSFSTENNYDYLIVFDGDNALAPIMGIYMGGGNPGTLTSSDPSGCLSFRFFSDGSVRRPGWSANISCSPVPGPPTAATPQDCGGGQGITICSDTQFSGNSNGFGAVEELRPGSPDVPWNGCINGGEHESSWYYFSPSAGGGIEFTISPVNGTDDYDFAIWGPYSSVDCPAYTADPPIRCSWSALGGNTGLAFGSGDNSEGAGGDKWVEGMNVLAGEVYILMIDNYSVSTQPFDFNWNLTGGAALDCTPLPVLLLKFAGEALENKNQLEWTTASEINNDYFIIEKSDDGANWSELGRVPGAGNSNDIINYDLEDPVPYETTYYRLSQVDFNGDSKTFDIISIDNSDAGIGGELFGFYPNPAVSNIQLQTFAQGDNYIQIMNQAGKVVMNRVIQGAGTHTLDMTSLSSGLYFIRIENNGHVQNNKIVVNH